MRASSFGDLIFVDHEKIKFGSKTYLALVIIDVGYGSYQSGSARDSRRFRQWVGENNCVPKGIVGDQAFAPINSCHITSSMGFILVDLVFLGLIVPRPQVGCAEEGGMSKECRLTASGYSPLEIATGRRRPDLFDVETSTPYQLSANQLIPRMKTVPLWNCNALP